MCGMKLFFGRIFEKSLNRLVEQYNENEFSCRLSNENPKIFYLDIINFSKTNEKNMI
jgi:hypothetical protein